MLHAESPLASWIFDGETIINMRDTFSTHSTNPSQTVRNGVTDTEEQLTIGASFSKKKCTPDTDVVQLFALSKLVDVFLKLVDSSCDFLTSSLTQLLSLLRSCFKRVSDTLERLIGGVGVTHGQLVILFFSTLKPVIGRSSRQLAECRR
jgi:hypothetical protein